MQKLLNFLREVRKFFVDSLEAMAEDDRASNTHESREREKRDRWLTFLGSGR